MNAFAELHTQIGALITTMPASFDTHDFIEKFSHTHQHAYIQALHEQITKHPDNDNPYQQIHALIGKMLKSDYAHLVKEVVDEQDVAVKSKSKDTFGNLTSCALWVKI